MNTLLIEQNNISTAPLYESGLVHMRDSYRAAFGAEISLLPPRLVLTMADADQITCAAGICRGNATPTRSLTRSRT